jgi:protein-S-isoprenylcysteine O-methyltransferase Ste14
MHVLGQTTTGIILLCLSGFLVLIKRLATGSLVEFNPRMDAWNLLTNLFNLFFLLIVNPVAALLLVSGQMERLDFTHLGNLSPQWVLGLEVAGLGLSVLGYLLISWALLYLADNYQLGGSSPRSQDRLVLAGPYRLVRHPMYTSVLCISLGLALLVQSLAFFAVFCIYLALILHIIPGEEQGLRIAYHAQYLAYQKQAKKLIPLFY